MKTIILNGSPRKNWNTAMMLKEARKGAGSVGQKRNISTCLTFHIQVADPVLPVRGRMPGDVNAFGKEIKENKI